MFGAHYCGTPAIMRGTHLAGSRSVAASHGPNHPDQLSTCEHGVVRSLWTLSTSLRRACASCVQVTNRQSLHDTSTRTFVRVDAPHRTWQYRTTNLKTGRPRLVLPAPNRGLGTRQMGLSCTVGWSLSTRPREAYSSNEPRAHSSAPVAAHPLPRVHARRPDFPALRSTVIGGLEAFHLHRRARGPFR